MSNQELMSEFEKWLETKGFSLYKNTREKFEAMTPEKCAEAIEDYKKSKMMKAKPDEDLKAMVKALLSRVEEQEVKLAEQSTKLAEQEKRIAQLEESLDDANSRIIDLESEDLDENDAFKALKERIAQLEARPTKSASSAKPPPPKKNGACKYVFTKGSKRMGQQCGRECLPAKEGGEPESYCLQHVEFVSTARREGYSSARVVERDEDWWDSRCKHIISESSKRSGQRCGRKGMEQYDGFCTNHQLDAKKKRKVDDSVEEDEEERGVCECVRLEQECICE
jgi:hypothetical protein